MNVGFGGWRDFLAAGFLGVLESKASNASGSFSVIGFSGFRTTPRNPAARKFTHPQANIMKLSTAFF